MADTELIFDLKANSSSVEEALNGVEAKVDELLSRIRQLDSGFDGVRDSIKGEISPLEDINGLLFKQFEKLKENKAEEKLIKDILKEIKNENKLNYEQEEKQFEKLKEIKNETKEIYEFDKEMKNEQKLIYDIDKEIFDSLKKNKNETKEIFEIDKEIKDEQKIINDEIKNAIGKTKEQFDVERELKDEQKLLNDEKKIENDKIKNNNTELKTTKDFFMQLREEQKLVNGEVEKTNEKVKLLKSYTESANDKIKQTREYYKIVADAVKESNGDTKKLSASIEKARREAELLGKSFGKIEKVNLGSKLKGGFSSATSGIKGIGSKVSGVFGKMSRGFGMASAGAAVAAAAIGTAVTKMVDEQSNYNEAVNATQQVYKNNSKEMIAWADTHTKTTGQSKGELMESNAQLGAMLTGMNLNRDKAAEMSKQMTQMGADLGSFFNKSNEDVSASIKSIITGETETLKDNFGIVMTQENLKAFAKKEHYKEDYKNMTQQEQVELRLAYVRKASAAAQGDYTRSLGSSLENQKKLFEANLNNLATDGGKALLPLGVAMAKTLNSSAVQHFLKDVTNGFATFVKGTVSFFGNIGKGVQQALSGSNDEVEKYKKLTDAANKSHEKTLSLKKQLNKDEKDLNKQKLLGNTHTEAFHRLQEKVKKEQELFNKTRDETNKKLKEANDYHDKNKQKIKEGTDRQKENTKEAKETAARHKEIWGHVGKTWNNLGKVIGSSKTFQGLIKAISDAWNGVIDGVGIVLDVIGQIATAAVKVIDSISNIGKMAGDAMNAVGKFFGGGGQSKANQQKGATLANHVHANGGILEPGDVWGETNQAEMMLRNSNKGNGEVMNLSQIQAAIEKGMRNTQQFIGKGQGGQPIIVQIDGKTIFDSTLKNEANKYGVW